MISLAIAAIVFAPVIEEAIFRGAVMRGSAVEDATRRSAIVIQGVLFGAAHFQPDHGKEGIGLIIALSVAGVGFGVGSFLLRRLGPTIIAHAVLQQRRDLRCVDPVVLT